MIAVQEARKLRIPIVAIVDTDCDPDLIDYVIPGNDDALRAIRLFAERIASAFDDGRQLRGLTAFGTDGDGAGPDAATDAPAAAATAREPAGPDSSSSGSGSSDADGAAASAASQPAAPVEEPTDAVDAAASSPAEDPAPAATG